MDKNTSDCSPQNRLFCYMFIEKPNGISGIIMSNLYYAWQFASFYLGEVHLGTKVEGVSKAQLLTVITMYHIIIEAS